MIKIDTALTPAALKPKLVKLFELAGKKIRLIEKTWDKNRGTPVFTMAGKYTSRGWTEWTQGFLYGNALLAFDATGDKELLELGKNHTLNDMAPHLSHIGVHDHGFNNVSTYGNILRLMKEGKIPENAWEKNFLELALKLSGAAQGSRFTELPEGLGYIRSFNGPHSLFADTIRSVRSLMLGHKLGHILMGEKDRKISLLGRSLQHAETTARFNVYFGEGRDAYDMRGRVVHESIFNLTDGSYRCPSSQQGYSPFTTWTRGLAWILLGFAEECEFIESLPEAKVNEELKALGFPYYKDKASVLKRFSETAKATADFYLEQTPVDGIPYWDTGAPELHKLGDYLARPAEPFNDHEPVDSSAAAISAQGLLRLGKFLNEKKYTQAGLTVANTLFDTPYLSTDDSHQGLILHSIYHRPNGWDFVPPGKKIPSGESSLWGDYHAIELALYLKRQAENGAY
ncbi:MAG: glycosyl hydrolase, partial [Spirochaetia bacterium]|nr:glycosyl hydrolase [Spirochaetia bacterium]